MHSKVSKSNLFEQWRLFFIDGKPTSDHFVVFEDE